MPTVSNDHEPDVTTARHDLDRTDPFIPRETTPLLPSAPLPTRIRTKEQEARSVLQFTTLCIALFVVGWNDGSAGPLLPRIRNHYEVGYTEVSLIFLLGAAGCVLGGFINVFLTRWLGFGKIIVLGAFFQLSGYVIQAPAPPFPLFVLSFFITGVGLALQDAQANGFVASLEDNATKMGVLHAAYGGGALVAPLVSTQFAQMRLWSLHYAVSGVASIFNVLLLSGTFKFRSQDDCFVEAGEKVAEEDKTGENHYRQIFRLKTMYVLAVFLTCYAGIESTLGSWSVTYILEVRHGGPNSGYVSAGFFGGMTLGRLILLPVNKLIGEYWAIYVYTILCIALQLVVWLVPSLVAGAVCLSVIGMLLGPMYPIAINQAGRVLPPWLLTGSIGVISGISVGGVACVPFVMGAIAEAAGIWVLQPFMAGLMAVLIVLWTCVPRKR